MSNMKKKLALLIGGALLSLSLMGCSQMVAKDFGGDYTIELPKGEKLVNITWKDGSEIWYLTEPMSEGYEPKAYTFQEDSTFGVWEGTVTIQESK